MEEKSFFVNLRSESSEALAYKVNLIVNELKSRTKKDRLIEKRKYTPAIDKPVKKRLSREEIEAKIGKWAKNRNLKVSKCLTLMKEYNWSLDKRRWKKIMKDSLLINNPDLFLISLTKKPYERKWINSNGEQKKASDYGDILIVKNNTVELNPDYKKVIKEYW